jgi:hypothetical protein
MAPIEIVNAFEEQDTSERSLTRKAVLKIEVGSELSSKQEGRKVGNFSWIKARCSGEKTKIFRIETCAAVSNGVILLRRGTK